MTEVLKVKNLSKSFKEKNVLVDINFNIYKGEVFGILGHNGAGKTTLMKCITGVSRIDSGQVDWFLPSKNIYDCLGVQMQSENFEYGAKVIDVCKLYKTVTNFKGSLDDFMTTYKLKELSTQVIQKLSCGEKRRLSIALALMKAPEVLILDESSSGLDIMAQEKLWSMIQDIKRRQSITVIMISHDIHEIEKFADRVLILHEGRQAFLGSVDEGIKKYNLKNQSGLKEIFLYINQENREVIG